MAVDWGEVDAPDTKRTYTNVRSGWCRRDDPEGAREGD